MYFCSLADGCRDISGCTTFCAKHRGRPTSTSRGMFFFFLTFFVLCYHLGSPILVVLFCVFLFFTDRYSMHTLSFVVFKATTLHLLRQWPEPHTRDLLSAPPEVPRPLWTRKNESFFSPLHSCSIFVYSHREEFLSFFPFPAQRVCERFRKEKKLN